MAVAAAVPLSATPAAGQTVEHDGKTYNTIREGRAYILVPPNTRTSVDPRAQAKAGDGTSVAQNVFYNPIQQFNRDLSVLAIKAFGEDLCARRRLKHDKAGGKTAARKDRKRKRKAEQHSDDEDGGVKLRKTEEGPVMAGATTAAPSEDHATEGVQGRPIHGMTLDSEVDGGVQVPPSDDPVTAEPSGVSVTAANDQPAELSTNARTNGSHAEQPWTPRFRILDALSATGLRALRYAQEIPFATAVTANDMDLNATRSIKLNVDHNKLSATISVNTGNAMAHMYNAAFPPTDSHGPAHINGKYDVIDLDPYGTAAPFIDSALQALNDGGLLCVTCTDSGVFASVGYCEKTYSLYGGLPIKGPHSHEGGLRLILNSVASSAAKYGLAIEPLLSLSIDFYVRVFIRVTKSAADVKFLAGKTMLVYECDAGCGAWYTQMLGRNTRQTSKSQAKGGDDKNPTFHFKHSMAQGPSVDKLCEHCNSKMHVAGPMWAGPLHNAAFVEKLLKDARQADQVIYETKPRIEGMLDTALNELSVIPEAETVWAAEREGGPDELVPKTPPETVDLHPFFFMPSALAKVIHCVAPAEAPLRGALKHAGYRATRSHCKPGSIKTDAPWSVIWEIMREWVRQKHPIKQGAIKETAPGWKIMQHARKPEELQNGEKHTDEDKAGEGSSSPNIVMERKTTTSRQVQADPIRMKVVFDEVLGKDQPRVKGLVRYQQNPRENWGPMARAKGTTGRG